MASYDRDKIVHAFKALYQTIMIMADIPASSLLTPPNDWSPPASTRKSAQVIVLMANLPYVSDLHLAYETSPVNYFVPNWNGTFLHFQPYGYSEGFEANFPDGVSDVTEDEIVLTMQNDNIGSILVLNTKSGMARLITDTMSRPVCQIHESDACPRLCRYQVPDSSRPVLDILHEWRQNYLDLKRIVDPRDSPCVILDEVDDEDYERRFGKIREAYRQCGWPNEFRAAECYDVLTKIPYYGDDEDDEDDEDENDEDEDDQNDGDDDDENDKDSRAVNE
ncbi:MAG: hypothetical protein M1822_000485 [Bathelium mastoideum]|nr:MAG: hypothetical protein M1822_000485 [Bathelium mastoideum]